MSALLARQASLWQKQEAKGELPDELYSALADGHASAYERRIIRNLAKISRIVETDGTIRPYAVFSQDWLYQHSEFGLVHKCELCGHEPIVENCVIENQESKKRIFIGNTCVLRYIEVRDKSGKLMSQREKAEFLKEEMSAAKKEFRRQDFAARHPTAMKDLARFEPMMRERKKLKTLHKQVVSRIVKHGYLGPKIDKAFSDFMLTAEADFKAWNTERARRAEEARLRSERMALEIAKNRNVWLKESKEWLEQCEGITTNTWEEGMVNRVADKIKSRGRESLRHGMARFAEEMDARVQMNEGGATNPISVQLLSIPADSLNEWEQGFVTSVCTRLEAGRSLSPAQTQVVQKLIKRLAES